MNNSQCGLRPFMAAFLPLFVAGCDRATPFLPEHGSIDLLIEDGQVLDGSGAPAVAADVAVVGDEIVFVGEHGFSDVELRERVRRRVDASGSVVAPGFIDLHSHGDPLETPAFENFLAMGVTTITLGQDGSSPAEPDLAAWLARVEERGIGPNLAMFVGHGTLRDLAGIGRERQPPGDKLAAMGDLLDETLDYTFGLSTGLEYSPGLYATDEELRGLARIVGRHDRVIMSHLRNEDDPQLEDSIAELLAQGEEARVHIAHLKSVYGRGEARAEEILSILDAARDAGVSVTADVYPYTASYTGIAILFPEWAKTTEQFERAKKERREELAIWLERRIDARNGPEATLLGTGEYTGKTLAELAFELEMSPANLLIDVIGPEGASAAYFVMDDGLQSRLLQHPLVGICSDGSPTGFHPRGHGAFARIIEHYVVKQGAMSLPEAVRKMTSFAAGVLGLEDRGLLRAGMRADLVVFDPERVRARASYTDPLLTAEGFEAVVVNGVIVRGEGSQDGVLPGRVLRPAAAAP